MSGCGEGSRGQEAASEAVDLSAEFQGELRDLARALPTLNYYELLGLEPDADDVAVREAFFERSKRFHPDRYFNKQTGSYGPLLTEIYKRVVAANDVLRDPPLRKSYDRLLQEGVPRDGAPAGSRPQADEKPECATSAAKQEGGPSLRDRQGLRSRQSQLESLERRLKQSRSRAKRHVEQALNHKEAGNWERAASLLKHALAFDPRDQRIHDELAEVVVEANAVRAEEALARGRAMLKRGEHKNALEMLSEASQLRPTDAELAAPVAELFLNERELVAAREFAERAVSLDAESVNSLKVLGQIFKQLGKVAAARKYLQRAWELDPMDREVRAELQTL